MIIITGHRCVMNYNVVQLISHNNKLRIFHISRNKLAEQTSVTEMQKNNLRYFC